MVRLIVRSSRRSSVSLGPIACLFLAFVLGPIALVIAGVWLIVFAVVWLCTR